MLQPDIDAFQKIYSSKRGFGIKRSSDGEAITCYLLFKNKPVSQEDCVLQSQMNDITGAMEFGFYAFGFFHWLNDYLKVR